MSSTDDPLKVDLGEGSDPQPSTETKKPKKRSKLKNFFSNNRFGGIPFAILYGLYLYFVLTQLILKDDTSAPSVSEALNSKGKPKTTKITEIKKGECKTETVSSSDDTFWMIDTKTKTLKNKAETLKGDATGVNEQIKNKTAFYFVKGTKVLSVTNDEVELKLKGTKIAAGQLWLKGNKTKFTGYFTLKNKETSQLLRATHNGFFAVKGENTAAFPWNQLIGASISVAATIGLAIGSVWSKRLRCSLILILPGLFSGRGRAMLMTLATGLLIDGPIMGITYNSQDVVRTVTCLYSNGNEAYCGFKNKLEAVLFKIKTPIDGFNDVTKELGGLCDGFGSAVNWAKDAFEDFAEFGKDAGKTLEKGANEVKKGLEKGFDEAKKGVNKVGGAVGGAVEGALGKIGIDIGRRKKRSTTLSRKKRAAAVDCTALKPIKIFSVKDALKDLQPENMKDIKGLKNKVTGAFKTTVEIIKTIISYCKKIFYLATLLFMIYDGYNYLLNYKSDDSFDNTDVDRSLRYLWENENYEELTPLRNWEKEETKVSRDIKLTKAELRRIFKLTMPSMVFSGLAITLIIGDAGLAAFLGLIRGIGSPTIKGAKGTVSADKCLPNPLETDVVKFVFLICIIILCFVTCFSDAYTRRWRSTICNLFYPETAMARARYLYAKIVAGRSLRKVKLKSIAIREKKRQDFEEENSIGGRMKCCAGMCKCCGKDSKIVCHGCGFKVESQSTNEEQFTAFDGKMVTVTICEDCKKDLDIQGKAVEGISLEEFGVAMKNDDF